ncbi:hypothetical protein [Thalassospira povalilytica]|uniref:hypothetical protein n=1 Tax=Thalassospira povalilytica TaxID=732237 RepID=UPI001D18BE1E|nr:hypothetical protein [Thalassospira povalilytica]MCC4239468.1 hypothetical protein [Thalassospira povalilytica]
MSASRLEAPEKKARWNLWLGVGTLVFCVLCFTFWFPNDIRGGIIERTISGRIAPGDSFFPVILAGLMMPLGLLLTLGHFRRGPDNAGEPTGEITGANIFFLVQFLLLTFVGLFFMSNTGPALVWAWNGLGLGVISSYRAVSTTFPINVAGFFLGGMVITCGFVFMTRHRLRWRDVLICLLTVLFLILVFNGLLEDVSLPPNRNL